MQEELFVRNTPSNGVPVLKVNRKWDILQGIQLINLSLSKKIYLLTLQNIQKYSTQKGITLLPIAHVLCCLGPRDQALNQYVGD